MASRGFAANVSILWTELPFVERFAAAAAAGFRAVEFWWPAGESLEALRAAVRDAGVDVVLVNFDGGDLAAGDRGLVNDPLREAAFRENVPVALEFGRSVGCSMFNALVGMEHGRASRSWQLARAATNVAFAARAAADVAARVVVEAINVHDTGPYLLSSTADAAAFLRAVGEPNVGLQFDVFHMARMGEDPVASLRRFIGDVFHVQVADVPGRGEPGSGGVDFDAVYRLLDELGYDGWIGAEYQPTTPTTEGSLGWLRAASGVPGAPGATRRCG